ncbi:hypothetical protein BH10PSE12_BH10PSE12_07930 [soil metagenome]
MTASGLLFLIIMIATGLALVPLWTRAFADLLWMFVLRKWLVGSVTLLIFMTILIIGHALWGMSAGSSSMVLLGMIATPWIACRATDAIALAVARSRQGDDGLPRRGFIFAQARRQQDDAYEAPPIGP